MCNKTTLIRKTEIYITNKHSNQEIVSILSKWFFPHKAFEIVPTLLGQTETRELNLFELSQFDIDPSSFDMQALIGFLFAKERIRYNSKSYFNLETTHCKIEACDYLVKYNWENSFEFGLIDYYLQIQESIYAVIFVIQLLERDLEFDVDEFKEKYQETLDLKNIFYRGKLLSTKKIIKVESINTKCIFINEVQKVVSNKKISYRLANDMIIFSEFITQFEHN